jgi:hypothetical protein
VIHSSGSVGTISRQFSSHFEEASEECAGVWEGWESEVFKKKIM